MTSSYEHLLLVNVAKPINWAIQSAHGYTLLNTSTPPQHQLEWVYNFLSVCPTLRCKIKHVRRRVARFDKGKGFAVFSVSTSSFTFSDIQGWSKVLLQKHILLSVCGDSFDSNGWAPYPMHETEVGLFMEKSVNKLSYPIQDPALLAILRADESTEDVVMGSPTPPSRTIVGLDPPVLEEILDKLEPKDGPLNLNEYADRGVKILNIPDLLNDSRIRVVPIIECDFLDPNAVSRLCLQTVRLREEYCGIILRAYRRSDPSLRPIQTSFDRHREALSTVGHGQKEPLFKVEMTEYGPVSGLYSLEYSKHKNDPGKTPYETAWDQKPSLRKTITPHHPANYLDVIRKLPQEAQQHLNALPHQLNVFKGDRAGVYAGGIGPNKEQRELLDILQHPYSSVLKGLPGNLTVAALYLDCHGEHPSYEVLEQELANRRELSSGTIVSWGYASDWWTFFAFHHEDGWMPSANLLVAGQPKVWVFIADKNLELLYNITRSVRLNDCFPHHRKTFFHPRLLIEHNIPFTVLVQKPGDLVIAGAQSGHQGWNSGPNLAVAVNFLDQASMRYMLTSVMEGTSGPWPCLCTIPPVFSSSARLLHRPLPFQNLRYCKIVDSKETGMHLSKDFGDVGMNIFTWALCASPEMDRTLEDLRESDDLFARIYRLVYS